LSGLPAKASETQSFTLAGPFATATLMVSPRLTTEVNAVIDAPCTVMVLLVARFDHPPWAKNLRL
jgi:hypothetical protein